MAKVTITITDDPKGKTNMKLESNPPLPGPKAKDQRMTGAQQLALVMMDSALKTIERVIKAN